MSKYILFIIVFLFPSISGCNSTQLTMAEGVTKGLNKAFSNFSRARYGTSEHVDGYYRDDGTYVDSYYRTTPNDTTSDNYGPALTKQDQLHPEMRDYDNDGIYNTYDMDDDNDGVWDDNDKAQYNSKVQ